MTISSPDFYYSTVIVGATMIKVEKGVFPTWMQKF